MAVPGPEADGPTSEVAGLVASARGGDQRAWRDLVGLYGPRVFALARSRLRNADLAEEVTQSVFATVATKLSKDQYAEHGRFEPWLFRIAMNRIRDVVRRAKREQEFGRLRLTGEPELEAPAEREADRLPGGEHLRDALGRLSPPDREIIELRYHAGMSFRQMTDLLSEPLGTLLARHHRALKKLKRMLEERTAESADDSGCRAALSEGNA